MSLYIKTREDGDKLDDDNNCSVIALSIACNLTYEEAYNILSDLGRKHGKGTTNHIIIEAIENNSKNIIDRTDIVRNVLGLKTVRSAQRRLNPDRTFVVFTRGHVLVIKDGKVHDWTDNRLYHIRAVYEVEL